MGQGMLPSNQIAKIERLIDTGKTGLLTLSFNANDAVMCLENGEIGYIFYKGGKGLSALSQLCDDLSQHRGFVKSHFDDVPVSGNDPFLPLTETVLNRLKGSDRQSTQTDIATDAGHLAPIPGVLLNDDIKQMLEKTLETTVGTLAKAICNDVFKTTRTLRVAVEALASELSDPALAHTFRESVRAQLGKISSQQFSFGADEFSKAEIKASAKAGISLNDEIRAMIEDVLPLFLGQQANAICTEVFARTTTLRAAIDHITANMSNPMSAEQFKDVIRKRLMLLESAA